MKICSYTYSTSLLITYPLIYCLGIVLMEMSLSCMCWWYRNRNRYEKSGYYYLSASNFKNVFGRQLIVPNLKVFLKKALKVTLIEIKMRHAGKILHHCLMSVYFVSHPLGQDRLLEYWDVLWILLQYVSSRYIVDTDCMCVYIPNSDQPIFLVCSRFDAINTYIIETLQSGQSPKHR